jgi:23S rRNA (cytidine2498-2'-O)-methyltransferase
MTSVDLSPLLLVFCRAGFEAEAAAECAALTAAIGASGYPRTERDRGYVELLGLESVHATALLSEARRAIFARQALHVFARFPALDPQDRLTPMCSLLAQRSETYGELRVEHPDSDEGRPLSALARSFGNALRAALRRQATLRDGGRACLHVVLLSGTHALLARSEGDAIPPWPQGIPRLRQSRDAPSRSALKLEEALLVLLDADERARWLKPGMKAADLGAAPGGWSWILARAGVHVTAIDNGPLAESALATGLIRHVRADGFRWQPQQPLDWMVCDMVEQPRRVAARMAEWFVQRWCRRAVFNLKLPMKKRYVEVQANLADFVDICEAGGVRVEWRARQLYHDREEITVFARSTD